MSSQTDVIDTVRKLRSPGGCPWDIKQTHYSLRPFLIEESYEAAEILETCSPEGKPLNESQVEHLVEELGDVLLQVLLHCQIASEQGVFDFEKVCERLNHKLISRHPHVFPPKDTGQDPSPTPQTAEEVKNLWTALKQKEKKSERKFLLDGISNGLPALMSCYKMIERVTGVGFQWNNSEEPWQKLLEELEELKTSLISGTTEESMLELGDVLFCIVNLAFLKKMDSETALRMALKKFKSRFDYVETQVLKKHSDWKQTHLQEMDSFWNEAKALEKTGGLNHL